MLKTKKGRRVTKIINEPLDRGRFFPRPMIGDIIIPPHLLEYTLAIVNEIKKQEG